MKIKREKKVVSHDSAIRVVRTVIAAVASAALGFSLGWFFEGKVVLSIIVFSILAFACVVAWVVTLIFDKKDSLLKTLKDDLKQKRYLEIIRIGLPMSRPLHIADKNELRFRISQLVIEALVALKEEGETIIETSDGVRDIEDLIIEKRIDDCGWSFFMINPTKNVAYARQSVREGIRDAIDALNRNKGTPEHLYESITTGLMHLLGFVTDRLEKEDELFTHKVDNNSKINHYEKDLEEYGDLILYATGEKYHKEEFDLLQSFAKLSYDVNYAEECLQDIRKYNIKMRMEKPSYNFKLCNALCRYYFAAYDINNYKHPIKKDDNRKYLDMAKVFAETMVVGYSLNDEELNVFTGTLYEDDILKLIALYQDKRKPALERMVKAMRMLSLISSGYNELVDAQVIMKETSQRAKDIDRTALFLSAQKHLISLNEKVFLFRLSEGFYEDREIALDSLDKLREDMKKIVQETKEKLNYIDKKMNDSCKKREKKYKKMRKEIAKKGTISWEKY